MKYLLLALSLAFCGLLLLAVPSAAQSYDDDSGSAYDYQSGNSYNWDRNYDGSTTVSGQNLRTGSVKQTEIETNGDMSGFDSRGNVWQYDRSSGTYINSDGTVCVGTGAGRTCN